MKNHIILRLLTILVVLGLTSCSLKDAPTQEKVTEESLPNKTKLPNRFHEAANSAIETANDGWLDSFNDEKLVKLVKEAIENNLDLKAASANLDAVTSMAIQAGSELKPSVSAMGKGMQLEGDKGNSFSREVFGLGLSWELDLWGRVRSQAKAGGLALEASQYQLSWIYQSIAAQTAKTWFLLSEAKQQIAMLEQALELYEDTLLLVKSQYTQGRVTSGDVALARSKVSQGKSDLLDARSAKKKASRALELLLGRYPSGTLDGLDKFTINLSAVPTGLPSELLQRRPDLMSAQRSIASKFYTVETAKAARLPKISLTGTLHGADNELNNLLSSGRIFWGVGANFMAPVYTGGYLKAQVDIESAQYKAAFANYGKLALNAFSEVEQSIYNEDILHQRQVHITEIVKDSNRSLYVATQQFKVGKVMLLSVLQQQGILIGAESNLISIQSLRLQQRVDFYMALGGDFETKPVEEEKESK